MSPASPVGTPDTSLELQDEPTAKRRVSSRMRSKPTNFSDGPEQAPTSNGVKRKRTAPVDRPTDNDTEEEVEDEESEPDDENDDEPDEEELKEARRRTRARAKKPAAKKSKTTTLAMRPAVNGVKKATKIRKAKAAPAGIAGDDESGLYGQ